jgi:hypothetical protein
MQLHVKPLLVSENSNPSFSPPADAEDRIVAAQSLAFCLDKALASAIPKRRA